MIIITTYYNRENDERFTNRDNYLLQTIKSVENQQLKNKFHIIVDDGSDKDIHKIIGKDLLHPNKRIIIRREKKKNELLTSTNARNFGINFVLDNKRLPNIKDQKYITFIDSDDLLIDLRKRYKFLMEHKPSFLYTNALLFFDFSEKAFLWKGLSPDSNIASFWIRGKLPYPTMTWDIDFLQRLKKYTEKKYNIKGPFDPHIGCGEDVDIALSSIEYARINNEKISFLPEITAAYRIHSYSLASTRDLRKRQKEEDSVIIKHFGEERLPFLHMKRFFTRPECYFSPLYPIKNKFRKNYNKSEIIGA